MGFRKYLSVLIVALCLAPAAQAANQIGLLGGLAITGASLDTGISPNTLSGSSKASFKLGLQGEYDVLPTLASVEVDLLFSKYQWESTSSTSGLSTEYSTNWWELPVFVNYTGIPMFKFGLGPVFDFATGNVHTENPNGSNPLDTTYAANALGTTSVALGFQVGYEYPLTTPWSLTADLRYLMGLANLSQISPETVKIHSVDLLVGASYAF